MPMDDVATTTCTVSPLVDRLPGVVGPIRGDDVAGMVDDGFAGWRGPDEPVKTLWILRRRDGSVTITGRRLDGAGVITLRQGTEPPTPTLTVEGPAREAVRPGGATADVMRAHLFVTSHVFYPTAGCWEFTVRIGDAETRIVRRLE